MTALLPVKYISIWDSDEIVTDAKLNSETGEIIDIETVDIGNDYNTCEGEFIEYPSGERAEVIVSNGSYFLYSTFHNKLINLIDAILGDLREFNSEGYPVYHKQVKKTNTGDSEGLYDLLDIARQMIDDLVDYQSENAPIYRKQLEEMTNDIGY